MGLTATNKGGDFEQAPTGNHPATCIQVIDLGMQESTGSWGTKVQHQCLVRWELPLALMEDGKPFSMSKFYTLSTHEKANLRIDLVSWRGRDFTPEEEACFDVFDILGKKCLLNCTENKKGKTVVSAVSPLPAGMEISPPVNPLVKFSIDDYLAGDAEHVGAYGEFSDWLKGKINMGEKSQPQAAEGAPQEAHAGADGYPTRDPDDPGF